MKRTWHHLSLLFGFVSGIASMIYLFLYNELMQDTWFDYVLFSLCILGISIIFAVTFSYVANSVVSNPKSSNHQK